MTSNLVEDYLQAALAGRRDAALAMALGALQDCGDVCRVHEELLRRALVEVGRRWRAGEMSVAAEHVATAVTQYVVVQLYPHMSRPGARRGRLLMAGLQGEQHQLGAMMVADALEADGWELRFLGSNVLADELLRFAAEFQPQVLALSCTMKRPLARTAALLADLRRTLGPRAPLCMVGGQAFEGLSPEQACRRVGADAWAGDLDGALAAARALAARLPAPDGRSSAALLETSS